MEHANLLNVLWIHELSAILSQSTVPLATLTPIRIILTDPSSSSWSKCLLFPNPKALNWWALTETSQMPWTSTLPIANNSMLPSQQHDSLCPKWNPTTTITIIIPVLGIFYKFYFFMSLTTCGNDPVKNRFCPVTEFCMLLVFWSWV